MKLAKVSIFVLLIAITVYDAESNKTDDNIGKVTKNIEISSLLGPEVNEKDSEVELIDESTSETSEDTNEDTHEKESKKKKVFTTIKPMNPDMKHSCDEEDTTPKTTTTTTTINPFVEVFSPVEKSVEIPMKLNESENERSGTEPMNIFLVKLEPIDPITAYIFHRRHVPLFHLVPVNYYYDPYFLPYYIPYSLYDLEYFRPNVIPFNYFHHRYIPNENKININPETYMSSIDNEFAESQTLEVKVNNGIHRNDDITQIDDYSQHNYDTHYFINCSPLSKYYNICKNRYSSSVPHSTNNVYVNNEN